MYALWTRRSGMVSATVASAIRSCQASTGHWLVIRAGAEASVRPRLAEVRAQLRRIGVQNAASLATGCREWSGTPAPDTAAPR